MPDFPIPYHVDLMESFDGIDMDAAGRVSGNGFYYLLGDIARLHEAVLAYGRDFMISKGFTYCIPPFMIHGNVVEDVYKRQDLSSRLGRGVKIVNGRKKGRIELEYYGLDDLNELLEALALLRVQKSQTWKGNES